MQNKLVTFLQKLFGNRYYARVVAIAILGVFIGAFFMSLFTPFIHPKTSEIAMVDEVKQTYVLEKADPTILRIPKIDLDTEFSQPLGLTEDKQVEVPSDYETVGYYKFGPTPGELGPAVVLGHVDSYQGPAVFFSLGELSAGDEIYIDRADGTTATFTVMKLERHTQSGFPTEKVYGNLDYAGLRLITCTGIYDRGVQRYSHNLIVYAKLKESEVVVE